MSRFTKLKECVVLTSNGGVHKRGTIDISDVLNSVKHSDRFHEAGAIALFIGVARGETLTGEKVQKLTLEAYEEKANEVLKGICEDLSKKPGIVDVQIHHLLGDFNVGEDMVYVSVAGSHRTEIFQVLREAVERYKKEAPVFKKESVVSPEGSLKEYWISEKDSH